MHVTGLSLKRKPQKDFELQKLEYLFEEPRLRQFKPLSLLCVVTMCLYVLLIAVLVEGIMLVSLAFDEK